MSHIPPVSPEVCDALVDQLVVKGHGAFVYDTLQLLHDGGNKELYEILVDFVPAYVQQATEEYDDPEMHATMSSGMKIVACLIIRCLEAQMGSDKLSELFAESA